MAKQLLFNGVNYDNLNDLGNAFCENFGLAIDFVTNNTKAFIKFIRKINKPLSIEIASIIVTCKYINNVITFIIFNLCNDKKVIINGKELTFKAFVKQLGDKNANNSALYVFMEDLGISRTFAKLEEHKKIAEDAYFLDKNIKDKFVYEYLTTYYEYDYVESLQSFISNIFIYNEENFRKATKIVKNERFQLILAHKVGFKNVYLMRQEKCPLFTACKLLALVDFDKNDLMKLVDDTFYWWLADRYVIYTYKGKATNLRKKLDQKKKEHMKFYEKYSFEQKIDFAKELYEIYLEFIDYYTLGLISVNKRSDEEPFVLDKSYCNTYICFDYMKDHIVKLPKDYTPEEVAEETETKSEYVPENIRTDEYKKNPKYSEKKLKKQEKLTYKLRRFASFSSFFTVLFGLIAIAAFGLSFVSIDGTTIALAEQVSIIEIVITAVSLLLVVILGAVLKLRSNNTLKSLNKFILLRNLDEKKYNLTPQNQTIYADLINTEKKFTKKVLRGHKVLSTIIAVLSSYVFTLGALMILSLLSYHLNLLIEAEEFVSFNTFTTRLTICGVGMAFGLLYGLLRKRKGAFTTLLILLVCIAVPVVFVILG